MKGNWQKLDRILFYNGVDQLLKKMTFSYLEQPDSRLILKSMQEVGADGAVKPPHNFFYNDQIALPKYNSEQLDHWGFYNGKSFFDGKPTNTVYTKNDVGAYTLSKASNLSFMSAGNLTSIQYPTGGSTVFEYQPHEYGLVANHYPFDVQSTANTSDKSGKLRYEHENWYTQKLDSENQTEYVKRSYDVARDYIAGVVRRGDENRYIVLVV